MVGLVQLEQAHNNSPPFASEAPNLIINFGFLLLIDPFYLLSILVASLPKPH